MPAGNVTIANAVPYLGELFLTGRRPNAFLKLAGHFAGRSMGDVFAYKESTSLTFPIGAFYSLPSPSQPARLEGANAPAAQYRNLSQSTNVVQIFTEAVQVSYLAQSDKSISGVVPIPQGEAQGKVVNPRSTEWQVMTALEKVAQDANYSFLNGTYNSPADPTATALATRGILTAIATNKIDNTGVSSGSVTAPIYRGFVNALLESMIQHNGYQIDETYVIMAGVTEFSNIVAAWEVLGTIFISPEMIVAGVKLRKILTRFGTLLLVLDPDVPAQTVGIFAMDQVGIVGLPVPNKGVLFEEPLFKQGSADQTQLYGQLGIDHGPEYLHGLMTVASGIGL